MLAKFRRVKTSLRPAIPSGVPLSFIAGSLVGEFTAAHRWEKVQKCFRICFEVCSHTIQLGRHKGLIIFYGRNQVRPVVYTHFKSST